MSRGPQLQYGFDPLRQKAGILKGEEKAARQGKEIRLAWLRLGIGHEVWIAWAGLRSCGPGLSSEACRLINEKK